jgi:peptide/nickel transport system substrate-binding protein
MSARRSRLPLAAALVIILAACTPTASTGPSGSLGAGSSGSTATGGTVHIGIGGAPDSLNPGLGLLTEAYQLFELVYDTPITQAPDGSYQPELAKDWSVSADGKTWTLHLVDNAKFHDGTPLTSADLKYTLELYRDTDAFPYLSSYPDVFTDIQAPDPTTLTITTSDPVGNFESRMAFIYVLPKHIWEKESDPATFDNAAMIGSGPFKLAEYKQGEFTRLAANEDYWNGRPNVDAVIFQTIDTPDARVTALTNGDVDMITEFPNTAVPTLQNNDKVKVVISDPLSGDLRDLILNVTDPANCPKDDPATTDTDETGVCSGHPALRDRAVRQALAEATDKQQLIDVALVGLGTPGLTLVPPGLGDFYANEIDPTPFNVADANRLLDEAGYTDTDGNGIRNCKAGQDCPAGDLTFRFNYPDDIDTAGREAELLQQMWSQIGVHIDVTALDSDTLTSICCPAFDYDVILWHWGSDPDPAFLLGVALCSEITTGFSETGYCNPAYDALYAQQGIETDHATRVDQIHQMQQILMTDLPYIIPFYEKTVQAYRNDRFSGWLEGPKSIGLEDPSSLTVIRPVSQ